MLKIFACTISFNSYNNSTKKGLFIPHFTDYKSEAQRIRHLHKRTSGWGDKYVGKDCQAPITIMLNKIKRNIF